MKIRGLIDEDFTNYKKPSMFIITPYCSFKCDKENGNQICQNSEVIKNKIIDIDHDVLIERYLINKITKAIVFGGLEPMDTFDDLYEFIYKLRKEYECYDDVVIYTGYNKDEIGDKITKLKNLNNIIVKFGRFIPNKPSHHDEVLGVNLASPNQYAEKLG